MNQSKDESYVVEEVLDRELKDGILMYKVKWKGYSLNDCTWEPLENFDSFDIIKKYEKKISKINSKSNNKDNSKKKVKRVMFNESLNKVINEDTSFNPLITPIKKEINEIEIKKEVGGPYLSKKRSRSKQSSHQKEYKTETFDDMSEKEKQLKSSIKYSNKKAIFPGSALVPREGKIEIDIPLRIKSAKQSISNSNDLLCEIEWKEGKNKQILLNSFYTNEQIKRKYPLLLIAYYERHLIFPQKKLNNKVNNNN